MNNDVERVEFRLPKPLRNALISAGVLLLLFVVAGLIYTFYVGMLGPSTPTTQPVAAKADNYQPITPHKPAPNARESAAVEYLDSPVKRGQNASITVKTLGGSSCDITVLYNHVPSRDSGLQKRTADEYGTVTWSWTVDPTAPVGAWPVTVTCAYNHRTAVVQGQLQVE